MPAALLEQAYQESPSGIYLRKACYLWKASPPNRSWPSRPELYFWQVLKMGGLPGITISGGLPGWWCRNSAYQSQDYPCCLIVRSTGRESSSRGCWAGWKRTKESVPATKAPQELSCDGRANLRAAMPAAMLSYRTQLLRLIDSLYQCGLQTVESHAYRQELLTACMSPSTGFCYQRPIQMIEVTLSWRKESEACPPDEPRCRPHP